MKNIFILLWLLGMSYNAHSQIITIKEQNSNKPLEWVTLFSEHPRVFTTTNVRGQADITPFKGVEKIEIRTIAHETITKSYAELELASFEVFLNLSTHYVDAVVVSASRWRQTSSDIPSKIISISTKEAALQNPQTAADLLGISGKVYIQKSQQGGGSPMIRGFATNRLLYTVDGVRMNNAIFRGGNIQNVISLDPFATESTEVFFGPGSVIYGSDAIGGVMSFQTLTPQFSLTEKPLATGKVIATYSSANKEKTGHFDINLGWKKWSLVSSISSFDYNDLRMGSHGSDDYLKPFYVERRDGEDVVIENEDPRIQIPSAYSQLNLMQKIRFRPNEQWDFQYGFHRSQTSEYGRYDRHNRLRNGLPRYGEWGYGPQKWMMNNLNVSHNSNKKAFDQMTIRLAQQSFEESRISRDLNKSGREIRTEEVEAYSANIDFNKELSTKNTLLYGFEYVINDVTSTGIDENISTGEVQQGPSRYPQATWQSIAAYMSNQYKMSDKFLIQAGLRYNQFILDAEFDTTFYPFPFTESHLNKGSLTGSIGIVHRPSETWVLSSNLATAFRSPNVDDIGKIFDSEPGAVVVPNPDLEAEYAYNVDIGAVKTLGEAVRIDLSGYYTVLDNALVRRDFTLNGKDSIVYDGELSQVQAIQNAAVANVYGLQAGIEVKLSSGFGFSSDFNYQKGEEELDDGSKSPSRHAAPFFGTSRLTYSKNRLNLQFYAVYQGERKFEDLTQEEQGKTEIYALDENGNPYSPSWCTFNLKGTYQLSDHILVSTGIENIADKRYRPYSSGISGAGRNFILSLRASF
ncbi:MAG: TonB-dependent receptor [Chitinophagales bacterium]